MERDLEIQLAKMEQIISSLQSQFSISLESQKILANDVKILSHNISKIENWINHVNERENKKWIIITIVAGGLISIISGAIFNIYHIIKDYTILKEQITHIRQEIIHIKEEIKIIKHFNGVKNK